MSESGFVIYARPRGREIVLPIPPRIAKWVGKANPLRLPLTEYLDSIEELIQTANVPDEGARTNSAGLRSFHAADSTKANAIVLRHTSSRALVLHPPPLAKLPVNF